jgi:hypothetical protein
VVGINGGVTLQLVSNISLNIFSGFFVLLLTSTFEYFLARKKNLEDLLLTVNSFTLKLNELKYADPTYYKNKRVTADQARHYIEVADFDLANMWRICGDLHFFTGNKQKYRLYTQVFEYIQDISRRCAEIKFHAKHGTFPFDILNDLQKDIFYVDKKPRGKLVRGSYGATPAGCTALIINKKVEHLFSMLDEIGQTAYFNKDYSFVPKSIDR